MRGDFYCFSSFDRGHDTCFSTQHFEPSVSIYVRCTFKGQGTLSEWLSHTESHSEHVVFIGLLKSAINTDYLEVSRQVISFCKTERKWLITICMGPRPQPSTPKIAKLWRIIYFHLFNFILFLVTGLDTTQGTLLLHYWQLMWCFSFEILSTAAKSKRY